MPHNPCLAVTVTPILQALKAPVQDLLLINVRLAKTIRMNWLIDEIAT
jgi:hypothetical protein